MARSRIKGFSVDLRKILDEFAEDEREKLIDALDYAAQEGKKKVVQGSPKKTGKYAKGWSVEKNDRGPSPRRTIYNKDAYLPHLLENGHAKRGGGRVEGIPHIYPAEQYAIKVLEERLNDEL